LEQTAALEDQKKKQMGALVVKEHARDLLSRKGDISLQNKCHNVKDTKILLKWKGLKIEKDQAKKKTSWIFISRKATTTTNRSMVGC